MLTITSVKSLVAFPFYMDAAILRWLLSAGFGMNYAQEYIVYFFIRTKKVQEEWGAMIYSISQSRHHGRLLARRSAEDLPRDEKSNEALRAFVWKGRRVERASELRIGRSSRFSKKARPALHCF